MDPSASTPDRGSPPGPGPAPATPAAVWLHRDAQTYGPYSREELRQFIRDGRAGPDDLVCLESSPAWVRLRDLEPEAQLLPAPAPESAAAAPPLSAGPPMDSPRFHHVAPWLFVLWSFATVGVYPFWWIWRCWRDVARRHPTEGIMPFWRGFFGIFWFHALCRRIEDERGRSRSVAASLTALAFFVLTLSKRLPDPWWLLQLLNVLPALYPVLLVDRLNRDAGAPALRRSRLRWWQIPLAGAGLLVCGMVILDGAGVAPESRVVTGSELSRWHRSWLVRHDLLADDERPLYFYSAGLLWLDTDGNLMTDRGLVSYYQDEETGERVTFRADFDEIHRVDVMDATGWPDDTTLKVWTHGNTADDEWFSLIFSPEADLDNDVVQALRERIGADRVRLVDPAEEESGEEAPQR